MNRTLVSANMRATPAVLPTTIGLVVALAGPFLVQFVLAPLLLQLLHPTIAVLLARACCGC